MCDEILNIDANYSSAICAKGYLLAIKEKPEKAMSVLKKLLQSNPNDLGIMNTQGFILYKLGKHEESLAKFDEVLENDSQNDWA